MYQPYRNSPITFLIKRSSVPFVIDASTGIYHMICLNCFLLAPLHCLKVSLASRRSQSFWEARSYRVFDLCRPGVLLSYEVDIWNSREKLEGHDMSCSSLAVRCDGKCMLMGRFFSFHSQTRGIHPLNCMYVWAENLAFCFWFWRIARTIMNMALFRIFSQINPICVSSLVSVIYALLGKYPQSTLIHPFLSPSPHYLLSQQIKNSCCAIVRALSCTSATHYHNQFFPSQFAAQPCL